MPPHAQIVVERLYKLFLEDPLLGQRSVEEIKRALFDRPERPVSRPSKGYTLSRAEKPIIRREGVVFWKLYAPGAPEHGARLTGPPVAPPHAAVEYSFPAGEDERWVLHEWRGGELVPTRELALGWNVEPEPAPKPSPDGSYDIEDDWEPPASG
jgi:hypothetical protein